MTTPDILVVCTANVARSPLFAALLQTEVDARLGRGAVMVDSAGVRAAVGQPAAAGSLVVASRRAISLERHRAQHVATMAMRSVSLVLTMSNEHNEQLLAGRPALRPRTFLLRELITILKSREVRAELSGMPSDVRARLTAVTALADRHRPKRLLKGKWNVPDPIRAGLEVYEELGAEFAESASIIGDELFGPVAVHPDPPEQRPDVESSP